MHTNNVFELTSVDIVRRQDYAADTCSILTATEAGKPLQ